MWKEKKFAQVTPLGRPREKLLDSGIGMAVHVVTVLISPDIGIIFCAQTPWRFHFMPWDHDIRVQQVKLHLFRPGIRIPQNQTPLVLASKRIPKRPPCFFQVLEVKKTAFLRWIWLLKIEQKFCIFWACFKRSRKYGQKVRHVCTQFFIDKNPRAPAVMLVLDLHLPLFVTASLAPMAPHLWGPPLLTVGLLVLVILG